MLMSSGIPRVLPTSIVDEVLTGHFDAKVLRQLMEIIGQKVFYISLILSAESKGLFSFHLTNVNITKLRGKGNYFGVIQEKRRKIQHSN